MEEAMPHTSAAVQQKIVAPLKTEIKELKKELKEAHADDQEVVALKAKIAKLEAENKALRERHEQADAERAWRMERGLPT